MSEQTCCATQANYEHCKYSTKRGWRDTSRYAELFGTPERAERTLDGLNKCDADPAFSCDGCTVGEACVLRYFDYDTALEWLRCDA